MTRAQLVTKSLLRNRRRTFLTAASVAVSMCLLGVFCATYRYMSAPPTPGGFSLLLFVSPRTSMMIPLPLSYGERIAKLHGVVAVSPVNMVDGFYGGQDTPLWALAFDAERLHTMFPDWQLPPEQRLSLLGVGRPKSTAGRSVIGFT